MSRSHAAVLAFTLGVTASAQEPPAASTEPDVEARIAELGRLAAAGGAEIAQAPAVALLLCDPELRVRRAAVTTLLALRPDFAPLRMRLHAIVSPSEVAIEANQWKAAVGVAGGLFGVPDLRQQVADLASADAATRRRAVDVLCRWGEQASAHQDDVLALARDPDPAVRATVSRGVAALGWSDAVREVLARAVKDEAAIVRQAAAEGLGRDHGDAEAVVALRGALQDPDPGVRAAVVRALGACGEKGRVAAADVVTTLRDREPAVRTAALDTVRTFALQDARAAAEVVRCLDHDDAKEIEAALRTATAMQEAAAAGLDRALVLSHHARYEVRRLALDAAWSIAIPAQKGRVALRLVEALTDPDQSTVARAEHHLGEGARRP